MIAQLLHKLRHPDAVSLDWLAEQERKATVTGFESVTLKRPFDRTVDDHGIWNRYTLRKVS